ncbi:hypothetical protein GETHED_25980 [Geothrix edaphica]|uniref:Integrase n=2 Tax=Geothrix edaphica TaxID=2927976 RepID=A0ABQ5Q1K0_9BACT|nr:hypothetical protein GETHED_25980 [Geothrix edaphica]
MLRVLMGYVAALLQGKSERHALTEFRRILSIKNWDILTEPWERTEEIELADILAVQRHLRELYTGAWRDYFSVVRRLYSWAAGKGIPGFTKYVCVQLKQVRIDAPVPLVKRLEAAPGAPRSKAAKNREVYDVTTLTVIAAYFNKAEGLLRDGQVLYRPLRSGETRRTEGKYCVIRKGGQLLRPSHVGIADLVLGWLAWRFGDRPDAFRKLRESHFEFIEVEGETALAQIRMPESKIRHADYKAIQGPLPMGNELARLVPELIAENREIRARVGLDNSLDWPLFMTAQEGTGSWARKVYGLPHEDLAKGFEKPANVLLTDLRTLFEALRIPDGKGGVIVPTFYSFRDGFVTNHILSGTPLEVIAALHNKQVQSIRPYFGPGVRLTERLNQVPEFSQLAECFEPNEPIHADEVEPEKLVPFPPWLEIDKQGTQVGGTGRCGCIGASGCPIAMNGSIDCYVCPTYTPIVEAPHQKVYDALWARREVLIHRGLPEAEYKRYDRHLAAMGVVIMKIQRLEGASK